MKVKGLEAINELKSGCQLKFTGDDGKVLKSIGDLLFYGDKVIVDESEFHDKLFEVGNQFDIMVNLDEVLEAAKRKRDRANAKLQERQVSTKNASGLTITRLATLQIESGRAQCIYSILSALVDKDERRRAETLMNYIYID